MKKLLLIGIVFATVFCANAASYRVNVVYNTQATYTPSDTNNVTPKQRIDMCIKANCVKLSNGTITKTNLINGNQISDGQLREWYLRGGVGNLTERLYPYFTFDPNYTSPNISDAQLDAIFLYVVWPTAVLIGSGQF
jgi:hypothetical protein